MGTVATANRTIGVDPSIIPLGTKVLIDGQVYIAEDIGGAVNGKVIDVFVEDCQKSFGRKFSEVHILRKEIKQ